jgi:hypothetical protein
MHSMHNVGQKDQWVAIPRWLLVVLTLSLARMCWLFLKIQAKKNTKGIHLKGY